MIIFTPQGRQMEGKGSLVFKKNNLFFENTVDGESSSITVPSDYIFYVVSKSPVYIYLKIFEEVANIRGRKIPYTCIRIRLQSFPSQKRNCKKFLINLSGPLVEF